MTLNELRRAVISAIVSNDEIFESLVLKGGNALLLHEISDRASLDFDFSTSEDITVEFLEALLVPTLKRRLELNYGLVVFGVKVSKKPKQPDRPEWGGFLVEFKLIEKAQYDQIGGDTQKMSRQSLTIDGHGQGNRKFRVEISHGEYTTGKIEKNVDGLASCYVYSLPMIVAEKLRAICQQMESYYFQKTPSPRPRDFYDIYSVQIIQGVDFYSSDFQSLVEAVFKAKKVPLDLLKEIDTDEVYHFHVSAWNQVVNSIEPKSLNKTNGFEFYFKFVVKQIQQLKALWEV